MCEFFQFVYVNVKTKQISREKKDEYEITFFSFCKITPKPISQYNAKHRNKLEWPNKIEEDVSLERFGPPPPGGFKYFGVSKNFSNLNILQTSYTGSH